MRRTSGGRYPRIGSHHGPHLKTDPVAKDDASPDLELVGTVIAGRYRVVKLLGQGGFGSVFLVELVSGLVGNLLALKLISHEFSADEKVKSRFLSEISVTMKLVNKYIVQVRDVGETETGRIYYTMDYCPGQTLAAVLAREGKLPPERAILLVLRVLEALRAAHAAGIIHRDLTPANVMVIPRGTRETVRILDFGIATAIGAASHGPTILGNASYMAPEQFLNEEMGFYTDTWAAGVILYECLTGQRPYRGQNHNEVYRDLRARPVVPPQEVNPALARHPGLSQVICRAMERSPELRYPNVKELFDDLRAILEGKFKPPVPPRRGVRRRRRRYPARPRGRSRGRLRRSRRPSSSSGLSIALAVAVLGTLLAIAYLLSRAAREEEEMKDRRPPAGQGPPNPGRP